MATCKSLYKGDYYKENIEHFLDDESYNYYFSRFVNITFCDGAQQQHV